MATPDNYKLGHVEPFWDESYKDLLFRTQDYKGTTHNSVAYMCGYWGEVMPAWHQQILDIRSDLNDVIGLYLKAEPGVIHEQHRDSCLDYKRWLAEQHGNSVLSDAMGNDISAMVALNTDVVPDQYKDRPTVYRTALFIDDQHPGHWYEINDKQKLDWKKGDHLSWRQPMLRHKAVNLGTVDRYVAIISGWK